VITGVSQNGKPYPIPSFNVLVNGEANFQETNCNPGNPVKEKSTIHIRIHPKTLETDSCYGTVWIYSLDGQIVLGPYSLNCGETLSVQIDSSREWGVFVISNIELVIDVWIDENLMKPIPDSRDQIY